MTRSRMGASQGVVKVDNAASLPTDADGAVDGEALPEDDGTVESHFVEGMHKTVTVK